MKKYIYDKETDESNSARDWALIMISNRLESMTSDDFAGDYPGTDQEANLIAKEINAVLETAVKDFAKKLAQTEGR